MRDRGPRLSPESCEAGQGLEEGGGRLLRPPPRLQQDHGGTC